MSVHSGGTGDILSLISPRQGHFAFESGHHGRFWLDLDRMFLDPRRVTAACRALADLVRPDRPEIVCGPMTGGGLVAFMVAAELGCAYAYADRVERMQGPGIGYRVPAAMLESCAGRRVAVVDDVMNAGSAVAATCRSLAPAACQLVALGALVALGESPGRLAATLQVPLRAAAVRPNELWPPGECPDCAAGLPIEVP